MLKIYIKYERTRQKRIDDSQILGRDDPLRMEKRSLWKNDLAEGLGIMYFKSFKKIIANTASKSKIPIPVSVLLSQPKKVIEAKIKQ